MRLVRATPGKPGLKVLLMYSAQLYRRKAQFFVRYKLDGHWVISSRSLAGLTYIAACEMAESLRAEGKEAEAIHRNAAVKEIK